MHKIGHQIIYITNIDTPQIYCNKIDRLHFILIHGKIFCNQSRIIHIYNLHLNYIRHNYTANLDNIKKTEMFKKYMKNIFSK